jgi:hypothetical protein
LQTNKLTRTEHSQTYPHIGQPTSSNEYIEQNDSRHFDEGFVFACGGNFDGADIAVIINIGLLSGNSC